MKSLFSLKTLSFLLFATLLLLTPGCGSDGNDGDNNNSKTLCELIEGDWEVTSYEVDGEDLLDDASLGIVDLVMEFEDDDCEGDFVWTANFDDGTNDEISGEYSIDEDDETITISFDGGEDDGEFDLEIDEDDDEMKISGVTDDGTSISIKAERD